MPAGSCCGPTRRSGWWAPTGSDLIWFNTFYDVLLGLWSVIGASWIILDWRRYGRMAGKTTPAPSAPATFA